MLSPAFSELHLQKSFPFFSLSALVLSLLSIHFYFKKNFPISGLLVFLSLLGMFTARHILRLLRLDGFHDPSAYPVNPQWSTFALFLLFFVIAIGTMGYMIRLYFKGDDGN